MSKERAKGNFYIGGYLYIGCVSDFYDSVNDVRMSGSGADVVKEKCTVANATKGAGTWVVITSGGGSGDVTGPAGATADNIAVYNGATGKIIKDGGKKISDLALTGHTHTIAQVDPTGSSAGTPIDTDYLSFWQGAYTWFKITAANFKAYLKSFFDLYYQKYSGFENRTESSIAINSGTGVFTLDVLAPATSFDVWTNGSIWNYTTPQTVTITDDQTITYVYIDTDGVLKKSISAWSLTGDTAPCAIVFKDGSNYALTDERHSYSRNKQWHNWAHFNIGAMYRSGLTGTFTDTTLSIVQGVIADEDIQFDTGGTKTTCTLWYRNATTGMRMIRSSSTPYRAVAGALKYDDGSGTLADVTSGRYSTQWVFCSNDSTEPIYVVIGQNNSVSLADARNAARPTINLSTAEWKLIYRVIYRNLAGTPTYIEAADFRTVQTGVPTTATTNDHAALVNRDAANSHPDTAIGLDSTYTGTLAGATTQQDVNDIVDNEDFIIDNKYNYYNYGENF